MAAPSTLCLCGHTESCHTMNGTECVECGHDVGDHRRCLAFEDYSPRSFHPDDAFKRVGADEAHELGLITDEMHALSKAHDPSERYTVTFEPFKKGDS